MIQLNKNYSLPERLAEVIPIKIVSVGGAGLNALDRIVLDGLERADVVAINTDVNSLTSSVATRKVQLGRSVSRGLGAGGDPDVGYQAALESADEIREALADASVIFICAGLGGGTGSGAAPYIAHAAREAGALVIAFATLPFGFEGKRRNVQAREALVRLSEFAHAVVCFENDQMGDLSSPQSGLHQAFAMADITISQSVRSIVNLIQQPGLIRIGFDDLLAALNTRNSRCLFGYGESDSGNRAHEALTQALKNPLMDRGRMLADATHVLVQVAGGPGMTLAEVCLEQRRLAYHAPATALGVNMHLYWIGVAADLWRSGDASLEWILREAAAGEIFAAGHAESGNDVPVLVSTSKAERTEGGYKFTGTKHFGSLTPVWTRFGMHGMDLSNPEQPKVVHAFMTRETPGYKIKETWDVLGMRATRSDDTVLENVFVPDRYVARIVPPGGAGRVAEADELLRGK
jgi:cell division protein FtsZ